MSNTAVRLRRHPNVTASLVYGDPVAEMGDVAIFRPGQLVGYSIQGVDHTLTLVFRTADPGSGDAKLPGVHPRAILLLEVRGALAASRIRNLFLYFERIGRRPESLSTEFWLRLDAVLNGSLRRTGNSHLRALLRHEKAA